MASMPLQRPSPVATESPMILLVEDEARVRKVMAEVLCMEGYTVLESATAEHALTHPQLALSKLTVLITDVMLPGKTGRQLARDIKDRVPGIKTILVSGYGESIALLGTEKTDAVSYLPKPFSATSLLNAVRAVVRGIPLSAAPLDISTREPEVCQDDRDA
jgi:two-component system cell cycle sensor histidine kinase/response regulator CckA